MSVLVLNVVYRPIAVTNWQDAITMVYSGRAELVEVYADRNIRSASQDWPMPCVVRFLRKRTAKLFKCDPRFTRKNVWIRDKGVCQYCGKPIEGTTRKRYCSDGHRANDAKRRNAANAESPKSRR